MRQAVIPLQSKRPDGGGAGLRLVAAGVVLAGGAVAVRWVLGDRLDPRAALELLRAAQSSGAALPLFLAAYVALTSLLVPAGLFHLAAGAAFGFEAALLLNLVAFNVTSNLQFVLARRLGRAFVAQRAAGLRLARFEEVLAREGFRAALLVRLLPLPNMAVNVTAGLSAIRWRDFALGSLLGTLPIITVYTWFAASLVAGVEGAREQALLHAGAGALAIVALAFGSRWVSRRVGYNFRT